MDLWLIWWLVHKTAMQCACFPVSPCTSVQSLQAAPSQSTGSLRRRWVVGGYVLALHFWCMPLSLPPLPPPNFPCYRVPADGRCLFEVA